MNNTKRIGDIIHTTYKTYKLVGVSDDELTLQHIYNPKNNDTRVVKIDDLKKTKASIINIISNISSLFEEEYPYLIVDLNDNIAFSKIPYSGFNRLSKEVASYDVFYKENVKLMFYSNHYYEENKDLDTYQKDIIVLPTIVSEFIASYNIWLWSSDLKSNDFYYLLSMMENKNFGDTYKSFIDDYMLYENTNFIK